MSKYGFVLFAAQSDDFIAKLRELGLVDITTTGWEPSEEDRQLLLEVEGHAKALSFLKEFREDAEHFRGDAQPFATGREAYDHYIATSQQSAALGSELARLEKSADELRPWGPFDAERTKALSEQGIVLHYFFTPKSNYEKHVDQWSASYTLSEVARTDSMVYFVAIAAQGEELLLDAQEMKAPQMDICEAERQIAAIAKKQRVLDVEFSRIALTEKLLAAQSAKLRERLQSVRVKASGQTVADGTLVVLEGWAEKSTSDEVDTLLEQYPNVVYLKADPTPDDNTPVKLKNHWFARVFELVGDMYARPKYGTLDLTPFFAPFYMLFFGICLNDAGYGAVLMLLGYVLLRKNPRPGMMRQGAWFATLCGLMTVLVGLFCGSFFGLSLGDYFPNIPFYDFQGQFFSVALAIGMFQILFGMAISIVVTTLHFGIKYAFGQLGWFIILLCGCIAGGLSLLNEAWVIPWFTTSSPAFYAAVGVGAVLMLLLNTPGQNPILNLGVGVWNFYNNITGVLSDVLSYIRLFAIGLSGGVLALVFNSLADGFVPDGANIVLRILIMLPILLIGHGINLFMSTISSFVHPMRLTFVEFYKNAGFEMATRTFDPIRKMDNTNE